MNIEKIYNLEIVKRIGFVTNKSINDAYMNVAADEARGFIRSKVLLPEDYMFKFSELKDGFLKGFDKQLGFYHPSGNMFQIILDETKDYEFEETKYELIVSFEDEAILYNIKDKVINFIKDGDITMVHIDRNPEMIFPHICIDTSKKYIDCWLTVLPKAGVYLNKKPLYQNSKFIMHNTSQELYEINSTIPTLDIQFVGEDYVYELEFEESITPEFKRELIIFGVDGVATYIKLDDMLITADSSNILIDVYYMISEYMENNKDSRYPIIEDIIKGIKKSLVFKETDLMGAIVLGEIQGMSNLFKKYNPQLNYIEVIVEYILSQYDDISEVDYVKAISEICCIRYVVLANSLPIKIKYFFNDELCHSYYEVRNSILAGIGKQPFLLETIMNKYQEKDQMVALEQYIDDIMNEPKKDPK